MDGHHVYGLDFYQVQFNVSVVIPVLVFANDFEYVVVCKGAVAAVDGQYAVFGDFLQCFS